MIDGCNTFVLHLTHENPAYQLYKRPRRTEVETIGGPDAQESRPLDVGRHYPVSAPGGDGTGDALPPSRAERRVVWRATAPYEDENVDGLHICEDGAIWTRVLETIRDLRD